MTLRGACRDFEVNQGALNLKWPKLITAAAAVSAQWSDRPERKLPVFELDRIVRDVEDRWKTEETLDGLSPRESRWLPHVLFHPESDRDAWLSRNSGLVEAALQRIRQRPATLRALLRNVLRVWPAELPSAPRIWRLLLNELPQATSPRLREWARRTQEYGLLTKDGPQRFAQLLRTDGRTYERIVQDAGLVDELDRCAFLAAANRAIVEGLRSELGRRRFSGLDNALALLAPSGELTFKAHAAAVADALLLPFVNGDPPSEIRAKVSAFLLRHLHDPRSTHAGWVGVTTAAKDLMLQWLVEVTLEQFFDLIGRWASEQHWRYREAFWSVFRKRGYLDKAWVVLGANAAFEARRRWRDGPPAHGRLYGGNADHCVLMLKIGELTVVEWSHNGACRVWGADNRHHPDLYLGEYTQQRLQDGPTMIQRHSGNLNYVWQGKLAEFIGNETGRWVNQSDYRVRP